jgi:hypothetical protein
MAIGDVTPKKLGSQTYLSSTVTAVYTAPANMRTQIIEIWVDNQNATTQRLIDIHAHGTGLGNRLNHKIPIAADTGRTLSDNHIVLAPGDVLAMKQDTGTDVLVTIYGYEEQIS